MGNPYGALRVYVAARFDDREDAIEMKRFLESRGLVVTSTWLTPVDSQTMDQLKQKKNNVHECRARAIKDFLDIDGSDVFLQLSEKKSHRNATGGKHVELGYSLAKGKAVIILGERENVFHYHPAVRLCSTRDQVLEALEVPNEAVA